MLISDDFWLKWPKVDKRVPRLLVDVHKDGQTFNKYNNSRKDSILDHCLLKKTQRYAEK